MVPVRSRRTMDEMGSVPIHRTIHIRTQSYRDSIVTLRESKDASTPKFLHVDVSGLNNNIESTTNLKVLALDASEISDYQLEDNLLSNKNILLKITGFPDDESSEPHTDALIRFVYDIFCLMKNCSNIIINCRHGKNRAIMLGARTSALIQHGINEPSREAYCFYQQFCKSVSDGYNESELLLMLLAVERQQMMITLLRSKLNSLYSTL